MSKVHGRINSLFQEQGGDKRKASFQELANTENSLEFTFVKSRHVFTNLVELVPAGEGGHRSVMVVDPVLVLPSRGRVSLLPGISNPRGLSDSGVVIASSVELLFFWALGRGRTLFPFRSKSRPDFGDRDKSRALVDGGGGSLVIGSCASISGNENRCSLDCASRGERFFVSGLCMFFGSESEDLLFSGCFEARLVRKFSLEVVFSNVAELLVDVLLSLYTTESESIRL